MSIIVATLSWGAVAFAKGFLSEPGKEAYNALKEAVLRIVSPSDVEKLELNPNSENRKGVIAMARCPCCQQGTLRLIAAITQGEVIRTSLRHLKLAVDPPPIAPARLRQDAFAWSSA